ncbi:MAG: phosphate ABC transporter ATP-binding protein PstB [Bdellovibrionota bacterium]
MSKPNQPILATNKLNVSYGSNHVVKEVNLEFLNNSVTAIIGPSGCGKSTLLRSLNRMNDFNHNVNISGKVLFNGKNIYSRTVDPINLRRQIGMVFQKPNPFPKTIYKNIIWGPKINRLLKDPDELVENCLRKAGLWDEIKDRLNHSALELSGGQQQRLCIARAIAMKPPVILMDEPCSALDPKSTAIIEELITELKKDYTIIIVTHNMQQASRISEQTAFMYNGHLIETGTTKEIFTKPKEKQTEDYITGRFG